ncbi:unannotated protein [freshwater metagenome]|uniref:Unannotated protein n=1 Tax=freshwater metagenome TaxID=449393 RepID=A0A6J6SLE2_9ZZZZ
MQPIVEEVDAGVCAHAQGFADGFARPLRAHRHDGDLGSVRFTESQCLFDRVLIEFIHHAISGLAIEGRIVGAKLLLCPRIRNLLHADGDLHGNPSMFDDKHFDDKCTANFVIFWVPSRRLSRRTASIGIDPSLDTSMK